MRRWPLTRGKGVLVRLFRRLYRNRQFSIRVGPRVYIPGDLDDYMVLWCFVHGYDDDPLVRFSWSLLRPGDNVIDVGAHIGLWSMGAARSVAPGGTVYALEPIPDNFRRLTDNLRSNEIVNVAPSQLAVSDHGGLLTMYLPSYNHSGHPSLGSRTDVDRHIEVTATTLDAYCDTHGLDRVAFIKTDTEGAEYLVLSGGQRLLGRPEAPAVLFEVNEMTAAVLETSTAAVKRLLTDHGYTIAIYENDRLAPRDVDCSEPPGDLFAFKPVHATMHPLVAALFS